MSAAFSTPTENEQLKLYLRACTRKDFTGYLEIKSPEKESWKLRFFLGRLVGDKGGLHPQRRLQRQFRRYVPSLDARQLLSLAEREWWSHEYLEPLLWQGKLSAAQMSTILRGSIGEVLFELALNEQQNLAGLIAPSQSRLVIEKIADLEKAPLTRVEALDTLWGTAHQQSQYWRQEGLLEFNPSLAPIIREPEQLRAVISPPLFARLQQLLDGRHTLWDLSLIFKKPLNQVVKSFSAHLSSGKLELVPARSGVASLGQGGAPTPKQSSASGQPKYRIAYLDDTVLETQIMGQIVEEEGHDYRAINSPIHALQIFLEYKPDLIFLDLVMPIANGYELCSQLRRVSMFKETPVVIVTGSNGLVDRVRAKLVGATEFIAKPISPDKVRKVFGQHLKLKA